MYVTFGMSWNKNRVQYWKTYDFAVVVVIELSFS